MAIKTDPRKTSGAGERRRRSVAELAEYSLAMKKIQQRFPDAVTVVDATEDRVLFVTPNDIKRGTPKNPAACAVAQCALRQGLGGMIGREFAYLIKGTEVTRYRLGKDAQVRTAVFDDRGTTTPGPVVLSPPSPSQRLSLMTRRTNLRRYHQQHRRKKITGRAMTNRKSEEKVRKAIVSHGFRTWAQA